MIELEEPLSERELDVLNCLVQGASNREIAESLTISQNTVKVHLRNIFTKLGASSRTEATTVALRLGLVTLSGAPPISAGDRDLPPAATAVEPLPAAENVNAAPVAAVDTLPVDAVLRDPEIPAPARSKRWLLPAVLALLLLLAAMPWAWQQLQPAGLVTPAAAPATSDSFLAEPVADSGWLISRPLPVARSNMALAAVGLNLYQIGGESEGVVVDAVDVYDTGIAEWRLARRKVTAVTDISAAVLFGEIYVPGGKTTDGRPTNVVEVYSPANDAWRRAVALPKAISGGLALTDGAFLYLFGGWDGDNYIADTFLYDPGSDGWRPLPSMRQPRAFAAGGVVANRLYVVGGFDGERELDTCEYFDSVNNVWSDCPAMLLSRGGAGAAVLFNRLYVIGGGLTGPVTHGEVYDVGTQTWQVLNMPVPANLTGWSHLGVAVIERQIFAVGGRQANDVVTDAFIYVPFRYQSFIPAASLGNEALEEEEKR
jgi:DNA-binding CsgD family transcriptional regulator